MIEINSVSSIESNKNVSVNRKSTENNSSFSSYLGESKSLDDIFKRAAQKYNVPENLLKAIGKAESNFNPKAVSRAGAQGVMQLMPATAKELGVTDPFDAEQNIMGGAKYISGLLKKYNGDTKLALAAYNAGSGNVAKYGGIPPFKETQNYVVKVMKYAGQQLDKEIAAADSKLQETPEKTVATTTAATAPVQNKLAYLYANSGDSLSLDNEYLDLLFSYDDYLKFVDLFLTEDKEEQKEEDNYVAPVQRIQYSPTVISLLKEQNIIE